MSELYDQFRKTLADRKNNLYYDEDDIIDIFDYAGDMHDDYIRLEALMLGYKLFPDSIDLLKRRAIYLADINDESFQNFISANDAIAGDDFMWEILRCRAFAQSSDIIEQLENLLKHFSLEEDEEIIQFVNLVHQTGQEDWLVENLDRIITRCHYPDTLKYEIARTAETPQQMEFGIKLLEQLTIDDAFNADYWGLLADLQSATGHLDDALSSLEYAKALNPHEHDIYSLQGYIQLQRGEPDKAASSLEKAWEFGKNDIPTLTNLIQAYRLTGNIAKLRPLVKSRFESDVTDSDTFLDMLILFPDEIGNTLKLFHSAPSNHDETDTLQRVSELCAHGHSDIALQYLSWYADKYELGQSCKLALLELIYREGDYAKACEFIDLNFDGLELNQSELPYVGLVASTLIRAGRYDEAGQFVDLWIKTLRHTDSINYVMNLVSRGLIESLEAMRAALENPSTLTQQQIDIITA